MPIRILAVFCLALITAGCGQSRFYRVGALAAVDPSCRLAFAQNPVVIDAWVGEPFSVALSSLLACDPGTTLNWSASGPKPAWLVLDGPGDRLFGTPGEFDIIDVTFSLTVTSGETGAIADVEVHVRARPRWLQNPIDLGSHPQEQQFTFDLKPLVFDPLGRTLTLTAENLPSWLTLGPDGVLRGTPHAADVGVSNDLRFIATDPEGRSAVATGTIAIFSTQPLWTANPIDLGTQQADQPFTLDLKPFVVDPFGRTLTFSASGLPAWLSLSPAGILSGTPSADDAGAYFGIQFVATAPDGASATTAAFGNVIAACTAPPSVVQLLVGGFVGRTSTFDLTDPKYLPRYFGQPLEFHAQSLPWATLTTDGMLTITPRAEDFGLNLLWVTIGDPQTGLVKPVQILVAHDESDQVGPVWTRDPIAFSAIADRDFSICLYCWLFEPNDLPLQITKVDGPSWVTVAPNGTLSGHPPACTQDTFDVEVGASNGFYSRSGHVEITVTPVGSCP